MMYDWLTCSFYVVCAIEIWLTTIHVYGYLENNFNHDNTTQIQKSMNHKNEDKVSLQVDS